MSSSSRANADRSTRVRRQEVATELGQQALRENDFDGLLRDAARAVAETLGVEFCDVLELTPDGEQALLRAGVGWREGLVGSATVPVERESRVGAALRTGEPAVVENRRTEGRVTLSSLLATEGVGSGITVVVGTPGDPWGLLGAHATGRREFTDGEIDFLESVADVLGAAVENERSGPRQRGRWRQLVETSPGGLAVIDGTGEIRFANERAGELLGRSPATLRGSSFEDSGWDLVDADGDPIGDGGRPFERVIDDRQPVSDVELGVRRPDGSRIWLSVDGAPLEGETSEAVLALEDVTERRRYQRRLERSERRYRTLVENFPNGAVGLYDEELRFQAIGGELVDAMDVAPEDRIGNSIRETYPETLVEEVEPYFHTALDGDESSFEVEYSDRHLQAYTLPVEDADGEVIAGMLVVQDVTEREQRERELRRYETIVEAVNDGVYAVDEDSNFTMVNEAYAEIVGYDREELIGANGAMLADDEEIQRVNDLDLADERPTLEVDLRAADGETIPVEATFASLDDDGSGWHRVGVVRDITERKARERALEESEQRYRTIAENFPNGAVLMFDTDLRYILAAGAMFDEAHLTKDDFLENRPSDVVEEELGARAESTYRAVLDGEERTIQREWAGRTLRYQVVPIRQEDGTVSGGVSIVQDVTEQVQRREKLQDLVERLEESNERLEQFAYAASHDLQEPLRMVSSYLQLIEQRYGDRLDEDGREFLSFAVDGADRMREMIDGLLAYARVDTRGDPFEPVDLGAVLADVEENLQVKIEESDAEITTESLPRVEGDRGQLRQVFQNLLCNAIEYSGEDPPRVHVAVARDGDDWEISVRDEGIGIDPEEADRVFEVFESLHGRSEGAGTGIGLALCERIVERHGGDIRVESEPGEGSTFTFTLPGASDADERPAGDADG